MKNSTILIIVGVILFIIFVMRKPINTALKQSRGYRNNNPGNIRLTFDKDGNKVFWLGEINGTDKSFKTFKNMFYGYRAMFITLNSYLKKGYNTIEKIISRYAPSNENDTNSYISIVESRSGIKRNDLVTTDTQLKKVIAAMSFVENGITANENEIIEGLKLYKS